MTDPKEAHETLLDVTGGHTDEPQEKPCPECGADLRGDPIPQQYAEHYGGEQFYNRAVGIEISETYDGVLYWMCPDCGHAWQRLFSSRHLSDASRRAVNEHNARQAS